MFGEETFQTTIEKTKLIEKIETNMKEHQEIFEEALAGYRKEMIALLEKKLEAARKGKRVNHHIGLIQPQNHVRDYQRVLEMLRMSTQDVITIGERQFAQYVRDEWDWKDNFLTANSAYSAKAAVLLGTTEEEEGV
jgi:hypothetical protein